MRRGWRSTLLLAALILSLTPAALAGTAEDPDVVDAADRSDPTADLRAAWVEPAREGARFHVQAETVPNGVRDRVYYFQFRVDGEFVFAVVGFGGDGVLRGHLGSHNGPDWERGGFERVANGRLLDLAFEPGAPATLSATIPWDAYDGLEKGATLTEVRAGTALYNRASWGQWDGGWWQGGYDEGAATRDVVLQSAVASPFDVAGSGAAAVTVAFTLAGAAIGAAAAALHMRSRTRRVDVEAGPGASQTAPADAAGGAARGPPQVLSGRPPT